MKARADFCALIAPLMPIQHAERVCLNIIKQGWDLKGKKEIWEREMMRNINVIEDKGNSGKKSKEEWE